MLQFEDAAKEAADEATSPRPLGEEEVQDIQVMLKMEGNSIQIRQLKVGVGGGGGAMLLTGSSATYLQNLVQKLWHHRKEKTHRMSSILKLQSCVVCNCDSDCMLLSPTHRVCHRQCHQLP